MTLDWIQYWSTLFPHKIAVSDIDKGQSISYHELDLLASKCVSYFQVSLNIKKGDRICLLGPFCIEYIVLFAVAQKMGIILVPLNYRLAEPELLQLILDASPKQIFVSESIAPNFIQISNGENTSSIESLKETILSCPASPNLEPNVEEDILFVLYTSGSTGKPKGVLYSHKMAFWNSITTSISLGLSTESKALVCMPPFHTGGWNVLLLPVLHHGGQVLITEKFECEQILQNLHCEKCNLFMAVPTMLKMMAASKMFIQTDLSFLPFIIVGGEAMPIELIEVYQDKGVAIRQGFGMTEAGPNLTSLHHTYAQEKIGSIGKPNMYVDIRLLDEDGKDVQDNERGELCISGPMVTKGYWKNPKASAKAINSGWLRTGDIAIRDQEGFLYIVDRIKNMYISGGENVYPAEVERIISQHTQVMEVCIIGVPDTKWGEVGKAFVATSDEKLSKQKLIEFCSVKLSKFKIPKHFVFLKEMPKNDVGKIDRKGLKELQ